MTPALTYRQVSGGMLVQDKDVGRIEEEKLRAVTRRHPSAREMADMIFAWSVAKHVKSNAIVYVKDSATVGIGAGQMSRVDSSRIAARKARTWPRRWACPKAPRRAPCSPRTRSFPSPTA
jgi:phosphoribosylaminoimidazolecarboxamide formyltransferase/IMP cyclohydrolase